MQPVSLFAKRAHSKHGVPAELCGCPISAPAVFSNAAPAQTLACPHAFFNRTPVRLFAALMRWSFDSPFAWMRSIMSFCSSISLPMVAACALRSPRMLDTILRVPRAVVCAVRHRAGTPKTKD